MTILDKDGKELLDPSGVTTIGNITAGNEVWEDCMAILDKDGKEVKEMPKWHQDVNPKSLMQWNGHWFTFEGIDPNHDPDVVFFKYKEPTKSTKRRKDAKVQKETSRN